MARLSNVYVTKVIKANGSYDTVSHHPYLFDLSKANDKWWSTVMDAGDVVVYHPATDSIIPRHVCGSFSAGGKIGWVTADCMVSATEDKVYEIHAIPGYGAVNAAAAHTNSGCFSAHKFDEASGNILDATGAYTGTATNLTYGQAGKVCGAVSLNGTSSYVSITNPSQLTSAATFSTSVLIQQRVSNVTDWIFQAINASQQWGMYTHTDGKIYVTINNLLVVFPNYTAFLPPNTWTLIDLVWNGSLANADRLKVYANGVRIAAETTPTLPTTLGGFAAGTMTYGRVTGGLDGLYDEARHRSVDLSAGEVFIQYKNMLDYDSAVQTINQSSGRRRTAYFTGYRLGFSFRR